MGEDDRRHHKRKKKQSIVSFYVIEDEEKSTPQKAEVIDGSCGGIRLRTSESLAKNTRVYIRLDSEDWGEELTYVCKNGTRGLVEVIGAVMWCLESENTPGEFEIGTCFIDQVEQ